MKLKLLFPALCALMISLVACNKKDEPQDPAQQQQGTSVDTTAVEATSGKFSVSEDKYAVFALGNLQYQASTKTWRFAENQYDIIGEDNNNISSTYDGWIDLFGWGTGSNPLLTTDQTSSYSKFVDWGRNQIGSDEDGTWRTPTKDEWGYIFFARENAPFLFALGSVGGVKGLILLPDDWATPDGLSFIASTSKGLADQGNYYGEAGSAHFKDNTYTTSEWKKMESAGAVFLPAAGYRYETSTYDDNFSGNYWSCTPDDLFPATAYGIDFFDDMLQPIDYFSRNNGQSVRLVKDVK